MLSKNIVITNRDGLDAKSAAMLVQVACKYRSQILIEQGSKLINAKSLMGVLSLGAGANDAFGQRRRRKGSHGRGCGAAQRRICRRRPESGEEEIA